MADELEPDAVAWLEGLGLGRDLANTARPGPFQANPDNGSPVLSLPAATAAVSLAPSDHHASQNCPSSGLLSLPSFSEGGNQNQIGDLELDLPVLELPNAGRSENDCQDSCTWQLGRSCGEHLKAQVSTSMQSQVLKVNVAFNLHHLSCDELRLLWRKSTHKHAAHMTVCQYVWQQRFRGWHHPLWPWFIGM